MLGETSSGTPGIQVEHQINYSLSVKEVISEIKKGFPKSMTILNESDFVARSRVFLNDVASSPEKLENTLSTLPTVCKYCNEDLNDWKHKVNPVCILQLHPQSYLAQACFSICHAQQASTQLKLSFFLFSFSPATHQTTHPLWKV